MGLGSAAAAAAEGAVQERRWAGAARRQFALKTLSSREYNECNSKNVTV